jgi:hypothetical protein
MVMPPPVRGGWIVGAGALLAAAVVGGLALGRALTRPAPSPASVRLLEPSAASPRVVDARLADRAPEPAVAPPTTVIESHVLQDPPSGTPEISVGALAPAATVWETPPPSPPVYAITGSCPPSPPVLPRAPRPAHHFAAAPATPRAAGGGTSAGAASVLSALSASAPPRTTATAARSASHASARDSLEDLIRKNASN